MKEQKVNTATFRTTKKRNKNILIIESDSEFKVGDDLELICFAYGNYYRESEYKILLDGEGPWVELKITDKDNADRLKTKITCVLSASEVNKGGESAFENKLLPIIKSEGISKGYDDFIKALKNAFKSDQLPDGYMILGLEVEE